MSDDCYRQLLALRAIRSFKPDPIREEDLDRILEAARWTGSSKNRQEWAFVVVTDPDTRERLAATGDFTAPLRAAPLTIVPVRTPQGNDFDIGRVSQNIMLGALWTGVASCPISLHREEDARRVLGVPEGHRTRWAVSLGYPSEDAAPRRLGGRKPLSELVHYQQWSGA
jgi:nitroreductase